MKTTTEIVEVLRDFKIRSAEKYGITTFALFGSAARGEQKEGSDIDICVKLHKPNLFRIMDIQEELEQLFHTKVDVITLHENMRTLFRRNIEQDAIYI